MFYEFHTDRDEVHDFYVTTVPVNGIKKMIRRTRLLEGIQILYLKDPVSTRRV